ncbi:MAG TPA: PAS domain S-box protein, partial [Dissulfurispiraceae bacterium]|nr:PAS domain S-box protein [Dissulfurispiraceae bacterium]
YYTSRDGIILDVNRSALELFGYDKDEMIGLDVTCLYADPRDRESFQRRIEEKGSVREYEVPLRRKDGAVMFCVITSSVRYGEDGDILGYQGIIRDRTERKLADDALRLSEEKFSKVFRSSPDWIVISALSDGRLIDVNDAFLRITGYTRDEVIGKTSAELNLWVNYEERAEVTRILREKGVIRDHEVQFRMKSGEIRTMQRSAELIDLQGEKCIINVTRDVTEKKTGEEQLRKFAQELKRSNEELQYFASVVAHDLQQPLLTTLGFLRRLQKKYGSKLEEEASELVSDALGSAERMQTFISALLDYSRVSAVKKIHEPVNANTVLDRVLFDLKSAIDGSGSVVTRDVLPDVVANEVQLAQLFLNLINNAIKFRGPQPPRIHVSAARSGNEWIFSVKDNGIGIPPDKSAHIFQIFQRLHRSDEYPGTGIGLAVCRKIVERHGGRIWVESCHGKGSTFFFTMPVTNPEAA